MMNYIEHAIDEIERVLIGNKDRGVEEVYLKNAINSLKKQQDTINHSLPEEVQELLTYWKERPDTDFDTIMEILVSYKTKSRPFAGSPQETIAFKWISDNTETFMRAWVSMEPVEKAPTQTPNVPECFDEDYKRYSYLHNNKSELLFTAMTGIMFTTGFIKNDNFDGGVLSEGVPWNNWSKETIFWASRNFADFCFAVTTGSYTVKDKKLWWVKLLDHNDGYLYLWRKKGTDTWHRDVGNSWYEESNSAENPVEYKQRFTKEEIMKINKDYWVFAVPVEEVE